MSGGDVLQVRGLQVWYRVRRGLFAAAYARAVDGVDLDIDAGESLGLVGETGCGKSSLGRAVVRIVRPRAGSVRLAGEDVLALRGRQAQLMRRQVQMVFQDPQASLNPRRSVGFSVTEPLQVHGLAHGAEARRLAGEALEAVGLDVAMLNSYPHQLSGGQRQRVGFARAVVMRPRLIVADEPVSALDMSVQAQVLNLMQDLKRRYQLGYLFISHDLAVVGHMCERVAVMYAGRIVESAPRARIFGRAAHPYTRGLLASKLSPRPGMRLVPMHGEAPDPTCPPSGCRFHPRCAHADDRCRAEVPALRALADRHLVACHHAEAIIPHPPLGVD